MPLDTLREAARAHGVSLDDAVLQRFERYQQLLAEWSKRMNLVGDPSPDTVQRRHFLESIALGAALRERELMRPNSTILDVGSGAGFPGAVLKIVWPSLRLTLVDATARKTAFLSALVDALELQDTRVLTGRAEALAQEPALRAQFEVVTARAVAPLPALAELTLPFARVGGRVVAPKGSRAALELERASPALRILGGRGLILPFRVPGRAQNLAVIVKLRETPAEFPRAMAAIKNRSLGG